MCSSSDWTQKQKNSFTYDHKYMCVCVNKHMHILPVFDVLWSAAPHSGAVGKCDPESGQHIYIKVHILQRPGSPTLFIV